jgi:SAM-dependent methyltransferase
MNEPSPAQRHARPLATPAYVTDRLKPKLGTASYLHLSDLLEFLATESRTISGTVVDLGAGGAPYRSLFANATYIAADIAGAGGSDVLIGEDGRVPMADGAADIVLSTQVLEHVRDPDRYLSECHRLLVPSGSLILTTHGSFHDHACPDDFFRWTLQGLEVLLDRAGFEIESASKLTCGWRAVAQLAFTSLSSSTDPGHAAGQGPTSPDVRHRIGRIGTSIVQRVLHSVTRSSARRKDVEAVTFYVAVGVRAKRRDS